MQEEVYDARIKLLQGKIKALAGMSREEVERAFESDPLIDDFRRRQIRRLQRDGFAALSPEEWTILRLDDMKEVREFCLSKLEEGQRDKIIVQLVRSEYHIAEYRTELAARRRRSWRKIYRAWLQEEIARLRWERARKLHSRATRSATSDEEGEGE